MRIDRQRGIALITVILIVALATTVASFNGKAGALRSVQSRKARPRPDYLMAIRRALSVRT